MRLLLGSGVLVRDDLPAAGRFLEVHTPIVESSPLQCILEVQSSVTVAKRQTKHLKKSGTEHHDLDQTFLSS